MTLTAESSASMTGSVLELMAFVLPRIVADKTCPSWPPDVFAVVSTVLRRTGTYVQCVNAWCAEGVGESCLEPSWPNRARKVGRAWRASIDEVLQRSAKDLGIKAALAQVVAPEPVISAWTALCGIADSTPLRSGRSDINVARHLLELSGFADEACAGIGIAAPTGAKPFDTIAEALLAVNQLLSVCSEVDPVKARVLPKKHTPQQGLTLRSLTHHLALCMPWEVNAEWRIYSQPRFDDVINLLLLPWPLIIDATHFKLCQERRDYEPTRDFYRSFEYRREAENAEAFAKDLRTAIQDAESKVSRLHGVIFPELALSRSEWQVATRLAWKHKLMLVAGVFDDVDARTKLPVNSCRVHFGTMGEPEENPDADPPKLPYLRQAKHHRWCLDRNQVLQYDLGGQLPAGLRCWENYHVDRRDIFFATLGGWLTFSVLICEDLARQDPIADVIRAVGPNLVIALLMDGPQLVSRWPARYASVLADDPGSSVLSLTSLGMCLRSRRPEQPTAAPSRVIGLWKDKMFGSQEILLPENSVGCVLSLACEAREEFTADGRSDHGATEVPVFAGVSPIFGKA